jgi:hypothetical protein
VPRWSLEIDTDRRALCFGGAVPTQGIPHRLRMLCGAARRLLCAQSRRASKNAMQPSDKGILLAASGFPAAFAHRPPGCKFARHDRPAANLRGCQCLWPFDPTKGPQNGRGRNNRATGNPSGPGIRATGWQFALHPCLIVSLTLCDPTPWATLKKWEKGCRQHIPAPPTNGSNPSGRISALSRSREASPSALCFPASLLRDSHSTLSPFFPSHIPSLALVPHLPQLLPRL